MTACLIIYEEFNLIIKENKFTYCVEEYLDLIVKKKLQQVASCGTTGRLSNGSILLFYFIHIFI